MKVELGEARLELLGAGAVYWPEHGALFAADLHLGKAETFQQFGLPLPSGHSLSDLERLAQLAEQCRAEAVYILGDLIHARAGLTERHVAEVGAWLEAHPLPLTVILGNHDHYAGGVPEAWGLSVVAEGFEIGGLELNHHPVPAERAGERPRLCGHLHPVVHLGSRLDRMRLPCFVLEGSQLTLPAFGSVTGGASARPTPEREVFAATGEAVVAVPLRARG